MPDLPDIEGRVTISVQEALDALEELQERIASLDGATADTTVTADTDEAEEKLERVQGQSDELDASDATITVTADTAEAQGKLNELEAKRAVMDNSGAASSSSSFDNLGQTITRLAVTGPMAATAIGGAFAALPGILSGVTGAVGGLIAGFMGISQAISAYIQVENTASQTGLQMQSEQLSAAQSLQNAAAQVTSSEIQLSQAQVQAYDQVYNAQEQLVMSEQQLEAAQYGQRAAQLSLTEATMQAKFQLEDYQSQLSQIVVQIQQAQVNLAQAHLTLAETIGDPAATQLQREQAQVAYKEAQQQVSSLILQQSQLRQQYALASSLGVQGSQQVQAAYQGVVSSTFQLQDAQKGVQTSQMMLSQAQTDAAQQMRLATMQLTQALQDQKFTAEQVAITLKEPIGAYGELQTAMAALGPAGQQFVDWFMASFYPVLKQLEFGAEGALLPGIRTALITLGPYLQQVGVVFDQFDRGFDQFIQRLAAFFASALGLREFRAAMSEGLVFMTALGRVIQDVAEGLGGLALRGGPAVNAIAGALQDLGQIFDAWANSGAITVIVHGFVELAKVFEDVFTALGSGGGLGLLVALKGGFEGFSGPLGLIIAFLPQLMPLIQTLFEIMGKLLTQVLGPLMPVLDALVSALGQGLSQVLLAVFSAIEPLLPPLTTLLVALLTPLVPIIRLLGEALGLLVSESLKPVGIVLGLVAQGLDWVVTWVERNLHTWGQLEAYLRPAYDILVDVWRVISGGLVDAFRELERIMSPIIAMFDHLAGIGGDVSHLFGDLGHAMGGIGGAIGHFFAEGGYVDRPTPAIVGEAGPEVILPINNRARTLELLRPLMTESTAGPVGGMVGGGGQTNVINLQAITNADPEMIAAEIAWAMKTQLVAP